VPVEGARTALIDLIQAVENIRREAENISTDILPRLAPLPTLPDPANDGLGVTVMLRQCLIEAYRALEPVRHLAMTGETDIDTWLRSILSH
jgi:hypothetical protein